MISFVIPVYQNQPTIKQLAYEIKDIVSKNFPQERLEILFVNDGSTDGSWEEIVYCVQNIPEVRAICLSQCFGQVAAISAGLAYCKGDAAIVISADLQDPLIPAVKMMQTWKSGAAVVIAHRANREDHFINKIFSRFFYLILKFSFHNLPKGGFDYFLLDRNAINQYIKRDARNRFLQAEILQLHPNPEFVPYTRLIRKTGKSQWTIRKKFKYFVDALVYTHLPFIPLFFFSLITFLLGLYTVFQSDKLSLIVFFSLEILSFLSLCFALLGLYLRRILEEIRHRPYYQVIEEFGGS
jgi:dolichol-phosphate mannosyltransferase